MRGESKTRTKCTAMPCSYDVEISCDGTISDKEVEDKKGKACVGLNREYVDANNTVAGTLSSIPPGDIGDHGSKTVDCCIADCLSSLLQRITKCTC